VCQRALAQIAIWIGGKEEKRAIVAFILYAVNRVHHVVLGLPGHNDHEGDLVQMQERIQRATGSCLDNRAPVVLQQEPQHGARRGTATKKEG
jgi:hypothetical protein